MKHKVSILLVSILASPSLGQDLGTRVGTLDASAFASFEPNLESADFIDLPVTIPVLGFPVGKAGGTHLESADPDIDVQYAYDRDNPTWYSQVYKDKGAFVSVEGDLATLTQAEQGSLAPGEVVICPAAKVLYLESDSEEGADATNEGVSPNEVTASCLRGGVTYSVTLQCTNEIEPCSTETLVTQLIQSLQLLDGDALKGKL